MRKHKIDFKKYADMHEIVEIEGKDGTKVKVRTHIPFKDKLRLAEEMAEQALMIHDDSFCYEGYMFEAIKMKQIIEYYTDIKTEDASQEAVADFVINNGLLDSLMDAIDPDWDVVMTIYYMMSCGVMETYKDDHGLTKAIRTSFGFLFNGEDITESMAKAEATRDTLYKALGALRDKEKEEKENINKGTLMVGNNILSFAKKE